MQSHVLQVPAHGEVPLAAAVGEVQRPLVYETVQVVAVQFRMSVCRAVGRSFVARSAYAKVCLQQKC